ncbi:MAG: FHA domain-containing protein [Hyphomicrobiaceae bacterium]
MSDTNDWEAWLEVDGGEHQPIASNFSIGRLDNNDLAISDPQVSRRHALVQQQDVGEFWLIDLGSRNGTYRNDERLALPARLNDGDTIAIGKLAKRIVFRQRDSMSTSKKSLIGPAETSVNIVTAQRWLLVVDLVDSTAKAQSMSEADWAAVSGKWMVDCSDVVKENSGAINKYLGDGFLAYWRDESKDIAGVRSAITGLRRLQKRPNILKFRAVLHYGQVALGGHAALAEESLTGLNVGFAFRLDGLASKLGQTFLMSNAARTALGPDQPAIDLGAHVLPKSGYTDPINVFTVA